MPRARTRVAGSKTASQRRKTATASPATASPAAAAQSGIPPQAIKTISLSAVDFDYVVAGTDGSHQVESIERALAWRSGDDLMTVYLPCGDKVFLRMDRLKEVIDYLSASPIVEGYDDDFVDRLANA